MKTLTEVWIYGCIIAFFGISVDCGTVAYPGHSALLAYSPARGEFPVASVFGRGFFSYIDESGNSRIVSLEASPLHGIRIDSAGRPLIEIGRSVDLEKQELCEKENGKVKLDKLKPIKEFDERPFQDSLADKDVQLPELENSKQDLMDASNPLGASTTNEIAEQAKQFFVFPSEILGQLTQRKTTEKPGHTFSKPSPDQVANEPHILDPITEGPPVLSSVTASPGQIIFNHPSPTQGPKPELSLSYLPPKPIPGPLFLNPKNPFLPQGMNSLQSTTSSPSTTSKPAVPVQHSPSTPSPVNMLPSTSVPFPSPAAPPTTSAFPSFAPGNPFLPTPSSVSVFPNSSPPPAISTPRPPPAISTPKPPPKNPFLSPDKTKKPHTTTVKPTPQFNADKMNPFLPNLELNPTAPPKQIRPHLESNSLTDTPVAIPVQVKDTPEVEKAKHEHFLAHQMALAQLEYAQQQDNLKRDETSSISSSPNTSPKLPCDVDTSEAVTSGQSMTVIPEPTEDSSLTTDAVPLLV